MELNFHSRQGEIDIVARDGEYTCFIEVKYRKAPSHGYPAEAVDRRKISRICKAASYYMLTKGISFESPVRFDVVCIEGGNISLIRNAFDYAP